MTERVYAMPFGASVAGDGSVRFALWAPGAKAVSVALEAANDAAELPMQVGAGGWFELRTARAHAGSRYRYRIDGETLVPDPASRHQPHDVDGPSEVIDPRAFAWRDDAWRGRPWEEAILYELHVGAFTPEGTFTGVESKLDHLVALGVTAIELMPIADFPGRRNWGYDGVLLYAPESRYGRPEALKSLVQCAHERGLMVLLDVVYNHFGPQGNYLARYAPQFFTERHRTPWGAAIDFDGPASRVVRDFFIHNALYWLQEYHFDGLRLDAVHAIADDSSPDIVEELAAAVRDGPGRTRMVHLVLENDRNQTKYLGRDADGRVLHCVAQWNDDPHHAMHVLLTGERSGYYEDFAEAPAALLARALAEGFAYQGESSRHRRGALRGEASAHLPSTAFVGFLQNHDQIGNRAFGERLVQLADPEALHCAMAIVLLAPSPPLLFMGEEWGSAQPFPFFCDWGPELAAAVSAGRRSEFRRFPEFADLRARERIPDPNAPATFASAVLDWSALASGEALHWVDRYRALLVLRAREIVPRLPGLRGHRASWRTLGACAFVVRWVMGDGAHLTLTANLGDDPVATARASKGRCILSSPSTACGLLESGTMRPWSVCWHIDDGWTSEMRSLDDPPSLELGGGD